MVNFKFLKGIIEEDDTFIFTGVRRIRSTWSRELAQDVSAFYNMDAEAELTALLAEHFAAEMSREIFAEICKIPLEPEFKFFKGIVPSETTHAYRGIIDDILFPE